MNPFKTKALEQFTIEDCKAYLDSYPYGDYAYEVNKRLKGLINGKIKPEEVKRKTPSTTSTQTHPQDADIPDSKKAAISGIVGSLSQPRTKHSGSTSRQKTEERRSPKENHPRTQYQKKQSTESTNTSYRTSSSRPSTSNSDNGPLSKSSVLDKILTWIGWAVLVVVVLTIIFFILDAILPEGTAEFLKKYRIAIYCLGAGLAKLIDKIRE